MKNLDGRKIEQIVNNATFSFSMEGFSITQKSQNAGRDILSGKITASEVVREITKHYVEKENG